MGRAGGPGRNPGSRAGPDLDGIAGQTRPGPARSRLGRGGVGSAGACPAATPHCIAPLASAAGWRDGALPSGLLRPAAGAARRRCSGGGGGGAVLSVDCVLSAAPQPSPAPVAFAAVRSDITLHRGPQQPLEVPPVAAALFGGGRGAAPGAGRRDAQRPRTAPHAGRRRCRRDDALP
jgi:hypothetical protein